MPIPIYNISVELSKKGDLESINKLIDLYLSSNQNSFKTVKTALMKTKGDILTPLLNRLSIETDIEKLYRITLLGNGLDSHLFFYKFLWCMKNENYYLRIKQFLINHSKEFVLPKDIILEFIIKEKFYDSVLISYLSANELRELQYSLIEYFLQYGIRKDLLKFIAPDLDSLELIQDELSSFINNVIDNKVDGIRLEEYFIYLNFNLDKNILLLNKITDYTEIYSCMNNLIIPIKQDAYSKLSENVMLVLKLIHQKELSVEENDIIKNYLYEKIICKDEKIELANEAINLKIRFTSLVGKTNRKLAEQVLNDLHKKTRLYSKAALGQLLVMKSDYAYRELLSNMLTTEDRHERNECGCKLVIHYKDKINIIMMYAEELHDENLIETLKYVAERKSVVVEKQIEANSEKYKGKDLTDFQIIESDVLLNEYIYQIASEIFINDFKCAVGFLFASGLKLLESTFKIINNNGGKIDLIIGSLQDYGLSTENHKVSRMDRSTAILLNKLSTDYELSIGTYQPAFYHGKFYYLAGEKDVYVIIGSSNISKTAFIDNKELNMAYHFTVNSPNDNYFREWFENFKNECISIDDLNTDNFEEAHWNNEYDINTRINKVQLKKSDITNQINCLTDEATKYRLGLWMNKEPTNIYGRLELEQFRDYIVFEFKDYALVVFESFTQNNAYYTFKCIDINILFEDINNLTKSQLLLSKAFINRGYHIQDVDKLEDKVNKLFVREYTREII